MQKERFSSILISLAVTFIISSPLFGQFNTYSPYTRFALGDMAKMGVAQNQAMGGTGLAMHEGNRINYLNPASFSSFDSTTVYFDFGANSFHNRYQTENYSNTWWNMNLQHVAFAASMGKYFVGKLKSTIFVDPNLNLIGLNRILEYNAEREI